MQKASDDHEHVKRGVGVAPLPADHVEHGAGGVGQPAAQQQNDQAKGMNAFMKYFFPVFSVFICLTSNAGFALYWVTVNIFATVQSYALNKYLDYKDAKDDKQNKIEAKGSVK